MFKARRIDELGLSDLRSRKSDPPAPSLVAWRSIARLDEIATHELAGRVTGFFVGGVVGIGAGIASSDSHEQAAAMLGATLLAGLGAWQGGHIGKRMVDERQWFVATPLETTSPVADTSVAFTPSPPALTPPSREILSACSRVTRDDHIRMQTDFGQFQGYAWVIGPEGVEGLRADQGTQIDRMAALGAALGALLGAPIPAWHVVYEGPRESGKGAVSRLRRKAAYRIGRTPGRKRGSAPAALRGAPYGRARSGHPPPQSLYKAMITRLTDVPAGE